MNDFFEFPPTLPRREERVLRNRSSPPLSPVGAGDANPPIWAPSTAQVAAVTLVYTRSAIDGDAEHSGSEQNDFSTTSSPTQATVQGLIELAVSEIAGRVGIGITVLGNYPDLAYAATVWHVAQAIEAGRNAEGAEDSRGAYAWYSSSYIACLTELIAQARRQATRLW